MSLLKTYSKSARLPLGDIRYQTIPHAWRKRTSKRNWEADNAYYGEFLAALIRRNPSMIVIADDVALHYITGKYKSLALCRGSVYYLQLGERIIPCLVVNPIKSVHMQRHGPWIMLEDFGKIRRWFYGLQRQDPRFSYTICRTVPELAIAERALDSAIAIGTDIETSARDRIACIGYAGLMPDGAISTYVIPFIAPHLPDACFWPSEEDEIAAWQTMARVNANPVPKAMQNGSYDSAYFIRYRVPAFNYLLDTAHMFHATWPESPKRLDWIASIACDYYRFWKDEGKDDERDDNKSANIPQTAEGIERYWRYNGMDSHYTLLGAIYMLRLLNSPGNDWALRNYVNEMRQVLGPAEAMSMRGVRVNQTIKSAMNMANLHKADQSLRELRVMVDDPDFNPASSPQVASLLYDTLQCDQVPREGRSTNEPVLKILQTQGPLQELIINKLWDAKKPANNAAKYGHGLHLVHGRWLYKMNAGGTTMTRYSSKSSDFWVGTQIQNVPYGIREMVEADEGKLLYDADYAQSDGWFTAFCSGVSEMMTVIASDKDTHCIHAAQFFQQDYDKIFQGYIDEAEWVVHSTKGVRQITKRVVYGSNYLMAGQTLLLTMSKGPVVAAAHALGYSDAHTWGFKRLAQFCQTMIDFYWDTMYPGLATWLENAQRKATANGNRATTVFGYTRSFFGNLVKDKKAQREFAAFWGQAGTAQNINKALDNIYWGFHDPTEGRFRQLETEGHRLQFQVHDSIIGQVPQADPHMVSAVLRAMNNECEYQGRTWHVPADAKIGLGWGKRMIKYDPNLSADELMAKVRTHDAKWWQKFQQQTGDLQT